jgi:acyl carrier protein
MEESMSSDTVFEVGDVCFAEREIRQEDYEIFRGLSFDESPLHSDPKYALETDYKRCVAPLFLASAPFSGLVGSGIPGTSALLLKSFVSAVSPIFYGDKIEYSLRISQKDSRSNLLTLRAIGIRGANVVLTGELLVKVREDGPKVPSSFESSSISFLKARDQNTLLLVGGSSQIGRSIALRAAHAGLDLVISYNSNEEKADELVTTLEHLGHSALVMKSDQLLSVLENEFENPLWLGKLVGMVTLNSSPIDSSFSDLFESNVTFNKAIIEKILPTLIRNQSGTLVNIGTGFMVRGGEVYSDYVQAKTALHNYFRMKAQGALEYGINWVTIAPDQVETAFSQDLQLREKLVPEEVADEVVRVFSEEVPSQAPFRWIRTSGVERGHFGGFHPNETLQSSETTAPTTTESKSLIARPTFEGSNQKRIIDRVRQIAGNILGTDMGFVDSRLGIGQIPGWDSARHLEIIMEIEQSFDVEIVASEYTRLETIGDIVEFLRKTIVD